VWGASRAAGAGFTLIEIMLVIVLASLLTTSAVVGFSAVRRGRLRAGASLVASAMRASYVHALSTGRTTRLVFAVGSNRMWIEDTDDAHVLDSTDPLRQSGAAQSAEDAERLARRAADLITTQRPRAPRAEFARPTGSRYRERHLADDVRIERVYTSHESEARTDGNGYVYFWSGGIGERAVVQLRGASGEVYSVMVHPLTGRSQIFDRAVEPSVTEDNVANDQTEVDARERPMGVAP
jgi:prepilin-type N-terminal cleavage/methylation domain-containing protein